MSSKVQGSRQASRAYYIGCPRETILTGCRLMLLVRCPMMGGGPTRTGRDDDDPGRRDFRLGSGRFGSPSFVVGKLYVSSRGFG
jgi:hypothetical protein